jgi:hypothetical protein
MEIHKPMTPEQAGEYIADLICKNRQYGETNNQVLCRLFNELITFGRSTALCSEKHVLDRFNLLSEKFDVKDLYNKRNIL